MLLLSNALILISNYSTSTFFVSVNANFFLVSFSIAGVMFSYIIEYSLRQNFDAEYQLRIEQQKRKELIAEMGSVIPQETILTGQGLKSSQLSQGMHNIFLSYRHHDSADVTGRIYDRLIQHFGREAIFKDVDSLPFGIDFRTYLDNVVGQCKVLLAVVGDHWMSTDPHTEKPRIEDPRDFVRIEIESALQRDIPVIPLLVRGATMPSEEELPPSLHGFAYRHAAVVRPDPDFNHDINRLLRNLESYLRSQQE
jgi:hypothetical protein